MNWNGAIERNSTALKHIVAMLVGMAGLAATPTSPSRGFEADLSDRASGSIVGREGRGDCEAIGVPGGAPHSAAGGGGDAAHPTLPRRLHRYILRLLRPAESAVRRLIVIAARGLVVPPSPPSRPRKPQPPSIFTHSRTATGVFVPHGTPMPGRPRPAPHAIALPLFDPLKRPFRRSHRTPVCEPRISYAGPFARLSPVKLRRPPEPDDPLDATRLTLRLNALAVALDDLPKQARRLARWRANRDAGAQGKDRDAARDRGQFTFVPGKGAAASSQAPADKSKLSPALPHRFRRLSPLRPGRPPGSLRRPDHEVHALLTELHALAFNVLEHPDTS